MAAEPMLDLVAAARPHRLPPHDAGARAVLGGNRDEPAVAQEGGRRQSREGRVLRIGVGIHPRAVGHEHDPECRLGDDAEPLLALGQCGGRAPAFGDVLHHAIEARADAVLELRLAHRREPAFAPVGRVDGAVFLRDLAGAGGVERRLHRRLDACPVVGMNAGELGRIVDRRPGRQAEHRHVPLVPGQRAAARVIAPGAQARRLDRQPRADLGLAPPPARLLLFGDVAKEQRQALRGGEYPQVDPAVAAGARAAVPQMGRLAAVHRAAQGRLDFSARRLGPQREQRTPDQPRGRAAVHLRGAQVQVDHRPGAIDHQEAGIDALQGVAQPPLAGAQRRVRRLSRRVLGPPASQQRRQPGILLAQPPQFIVVLVHRRSMLAQPSAPIVRPRFSRRSARAGPRCATVRRRPGCHGRAASAPGTRSRHPSRCARTARWRPACWSRRRCRARG